MQQYSGRIAETNALCAKVLAKYAIDAVYKPSSKLRLALNTRWAMRPVSHSLLLSVGVAKGSFGLVLGGEIE